VSLLCCCFVSPPIICISHIHFLSSVLFMFCKSRMLRPPISFDMVLEPLIRVNAYSALCDISFLENQPVTALHPTETYLFLSLIDHFLSLPLILLRLSLPLINHHLLTLLPLHLFLHLLLLLLYSSHDDHVENKITQAKSLS
jgi:hypothetical protein